ADARQVVDVARALVHHVESLHALGIVHGALHERNVIVERDGGVRLTHVSPLLHSDPDQDVAALLRLLRLLGFSAALERLPSGQPVQLHAVRAALGAWSKLRFAEGDSGQSSSSAQPGASATAQTEEENRWRRASLLAALAVALAGAAIAFVLWRLA